MTTTATPQTKPSTGWFEVPRCRHCEKCPATANRGLCAKCYYAPGVREQYPRLNPRGTSCVECHQRKGESRRRGLCRTCWNDETIRKLYPAQVGHNGPAAKKSEATTAGLVCDWSQLKPARPDRCVHGIKDGLCAPCEAAQRAAMGLLAQAEDEEAA